MEAAQLWVIEHHFEIIAAALGFVAIFLQIRQNVWYWFVSIVMVSMYIYIYIDAKLYADMSLQVYYLVISFYGWYLWLFGKRSKDHRVPLPVSTTAHRLVLLTISVTLFFLMAWFLKYYTDSDLPYWDSFTTALSFVATWMLAKKKIENWLIWIVVDAVSVGIYIHKELYPTAVLFFFLTILAVVGYRQWKKDMVLV